MKWAAWPYAQRCACHFPSGWRQDTEPAGLCCRPFSLLALRLLCFSWYWAISWYGRVVLTWYVLPWRCWPCCRYVVRRGFHIDVMLATQLLGELCVVDTVSARVWLVVLDLKPRTV